MTMMEARGTSEILGKVVMQGLDLAQGAWDKKEKRVRRGRDYEEVSHEWILYFSSQSMLPESVGIPKHRSLKE